MAICREHDVSRHTAREALRILAEDRLIERRQGASSVVTDTPAPAFAQAVGDFDSILQFARDAAFVLLESAEADDDTLAAVGLTGSYQQYAGLRQVAGQPPIAVSTIFIAREFAPNDDTVNQLQESFSEWIERTHETWVEEVEQRMEAVALEDAQAKQIDVTAKTPALRTIRRYRDANGRVIMLSESLHPAGRFAYTMRMERRR